jgi:hypothetical protein
MSLTIQQRRCDSCRHDRTRTPMGNINHPPDWEPGCAVIDGEPAPKAAALRRYARNGETYWHIVEHGGCPSWQPWRSCETHGLPVHPADGMCSECEAEVVRAEDAAYARYSQSGEPWP